MNIWSEHYPYETASTNNGADALKPEAFAALGFKYEETLYDPEQDKFLTKEKYLEQEKADPAKIMVVFNPARVKWMPN